MKPRLYALYARYCGHVLAVHPDRPTVDTSRQTAAERRIHHLRVRVADPADYEIALKGERCDLCEPAAIPVPDEAHPARCGVCDRRDVLGWHSIGCRAAAAAYAEWNKTEAINAA